MLAIRKQIQWTALAGCAVLSLTALAHGQTGPGAMSGQVGASGPYPLAGARTPGFMNPMANLPAVTATGPYATIQTNPIASGGAYDGGYQNPYQYSYADPYGGYLRGAADVINAQGRFLVNTQQSLLLREQVRQAHMETRRRVFDEWLYERANRPTVEDERERTMREQVRRFRNDPPLTEIWSGDALNALLRDIQKLEEKGLKGPDKTLDQDILRRINVTTQQGGNVGVLKNEAQLHWPLALRTEETRDTREQLDSLVKEAVNQAMNSSTVSAETLKQIDAATKQLRDRLTRQVGDLPFAQYREAKRFLNDLDEARRALEKPDAGKYFTGRYAANGKSVSELARYMAQQGLLFAPATSGDEAAYTALHRALAAYDVATNTLATDRSER